MHCAFNLFVDWSGRGWNDRLGFGYLGEFFPELVVDQGGEVGGAGWLYTRVVIPKEIVNEAFVNAYCFFRIKVAIHQSID